MSKRALIEPRWLDVMLTRWGIAALNRSCGGYPKESSMFKERIDRGVTSYEPTGVTVEDYRALEDAINAMPQHFVMVITRAYKPWTYAHITETLQEHYSCSDRTLQRWLHEAAAQILSKMNEKQLTVAGNVAKF